MGRSRNTALILVSQNAGDLLTEQVTNCISSVFAFRSSERAEVANVMALLGVEPSADHQAVLRGLGNGECIFRDLEGRAGRIGIDLISEEMRRWLDTNPTRSRPGEPAPVAGAAPTPAAYASAGLTPAPRSAGPAAEQPGPGPAPEPSAHANTAMAPAQPGQARPRRRRSTHGGSSLRGAGHRRRGRREIQRGGCRLWGVRHYRSSRLRAAPRIDEESNMPSTHITDLATLTRSGAPDMPTSTPKPRQRHQLLDVSQPSPAGQPRLAGR